MKKRTISDRPHVLEDHINITRFLPPITLLVIGIILQTTSFLFGIHAIQTHHLPPDSTLEDMQSAAQELEIELEKINIVGILGAIFIIVGFVWAVLIAIVEIRFRKKKGGDEE